MADTGNLRVEHFDRNRDFVGSWGGFGTGSGHFSEPTAIGVDAAGLVYVLGLGRRDIQQFDSDGTYLNTYADKVAGNALFVHPDGRIYTTALPNGAPGLTEYNPDKTIEGTIELSTLVGTPTGIAVDEQRDVFVGAVDRLARLSTGGSPQTLWTTQADRLWPTNAESIAITSDGLSLYVTSRVSPYLRKYFLAAGGEPPPSGSPSGTLLLPNGGGRQGIAPATYATNFQPALTFTVNRFDPRSEAYVDQPGWIDLSFGASPMVEMFIVRVDKVFDPTDLGALVDPPANLAGWIADHSGLTVVAPPPKAIRVGGLDGQQLDVLVGETDLFFAPIPANSVPLGAERRHAVRFVTVTVDGHQVVITFMAQEESVAHFDTAVQVFQPLIESMIWN